MSSLPLAAAVAVALLAALAACGPADESGAGGQGGADGGGGGSATAPTVTYSGCIALDGLEGPAEKGGFRWFVLDRPEIPAVLTDPDEGCFALSGLPPNEDLLIAWTKEGYVQRFWSVHTGTRDFHETRPIWTMHVEFMVGTFADWMGFVPDPSAGRVGVGMWDGSTAYDRDLARDIPVSASFSLEPACYLPEQNWSETEGCGTPEQHSGLVGFFDVPLGEVELELGSGEVDCTPVHSDDGWAFAWTVEGRPNHIRVEVREGWETFAWVSCGG